MRVLLLQLDGSVPNIALMRLATHHRERGDEVQLRRAGNLAAVGRRWDEAPHDLVYASLIFERTRPVAEALLRERPDAVVGGTGWDLTATLEDHGVTTKVQDYSVYPRYAHSIGFTQRGCRLRCSFCVVPKKEGPARHEQTALDVWRGGEHPRELVLLDNDFFGVPTWRDRIREIRDGGFRVYFNQGINARALTEEAAEAVGSVDYRDDSMKRKRVYTAWDSRGDEKPLFRGLTRLVRHGVKPDHIMVYMLVGYWPGETAADREYRRARLRAFGARPYPMPFVRTRELVGFQRWVVGAYDKKISWADWSRAGYQPARLDLRTQEMF